jgi:hypothetical protein
MSTIETNLNIGSNRNTYDPPVANEVLAALWRATRIDALAEEDLPYNLTPLRSELAVEYAQRQREEIINALDSGSLSPEDQAQYTETLMFMDALDVAGNDALHQLRRADRRYSGSLRHKVEATQHMKKDVARYLATHPNMENSDGYNYILKTLVDSSNVINPKSTKAKDRMSMILNGIVTEYNLLAGLQSLGLDVRAANVDEDMDKKDMIQSSNPALPESIQVKTWHEFAVHIYDDHILILVPIRPNPFKLQPDQLDELQDKFGSQSAMPLVA